MERKLITIALVAMALMALSAPTLNIADNDKSYGSGTVCVEKISGDYCFPFTNTITNTGLNNTRDMRMGVIRGNWTAMMLSTGTTAAAATDTACEATLLTTNGFAPAYGTAAVVAANIGNYSTTYKWTSTAAQAGIAKVCLTNNTSTSNYELLASFKFASAVNIENANENITVTYYIGAT